MEKLYQGHQRNSSYSPRIRSQNVSSQCLNQISKEKTLPQHRSPKYRFPTVGQLTDYNERIRNLQEVSQDQDSCTPMAKLGKHMHLAAEQAFT